MHTAQNRALSRETFLEVADVVERLMFGALDGPPRLANGQERIRMLDGGTYRIVAPTRGGARGPANDLVLIDEAREFDTFDFVAAARPTLTASRDPQLWYLSSAGDEQSVVLNAVRVRAENDPDLAWIEWSPHPSRSVDDRAGWREANPALGHTIRMATLDSAFRQLPRAIFETEHLSRWVTSLLPHLVPDVAWLRAAAVLGAPDHPAMGLSVDPSGQRASAALAWRQADGTIALTVTADVHGDPLDVDALGELLAKRAGQLYIGAIGFDPATDQDLARYLPAAKPIAGQTFAAACDRFARSVDAGRLRHQGADQVGADIPYTVRRPGTAGAWSAIRAKDDRPVTAALAAIRAVWLATSPDSGAPAVY